MAKKTKETKREITLHKALVELKTLDSRIIKKANDHLIAWKQGEKWVHNVLPMKEFEDWVKANYQSMRDLLEEKENIKKGVMKANSTTKITVGNVGMFIIDAINKKDSIKLERQIIQTLKNQIAENTNFVNNNNSNVKIALDKILEVSVQKDIKTTSADIEAISAPYMKTNEFALVDPLKLKDKLEKWETEIESFELDIDSALSTANALTTIKI